MPAAKQFKLKVTKAQQMIPKATRDLLDKLVELSRLTGCKVCCVVACIQPACILCLFWLSASLGSKVFCVLYRGGLLAATWDVTSLVS